MGEHSLSRTELVIGAEGLERLRNSKVVVLGVGGVGSFSVEALARAGVGRLILVDNDTYSISNLNRQLGATYDTIDRSKVQVMKERVALINRECEVLPLETFITPENVHEVISEDTDYVVDAIDNITAKLAVAVYCQERGIKLISSMGTGNKMDPTKFRVTDIFKTKVDPLAKVMRYELRKRGVKSLKVVYSEEEPRKPRYQEVAGYEAYGDNSKDIEKPSVKRQVPGSISFVPPVAGMIIASVVVRELLGEEVKG